MSLDALSLIFPALSVHHGLALIAALVEFVDLHLPLVDLLLKVLCMMCMLCWFVAHFD